MPVVEAFLGAFLSVLFQRLTSPELLKLATREGIRSKLIKWETKFKMIQALLNDAEEKQLTDGAVQTWLDDLRDLAYDVEDILDAFATEALRRKLKAEDHASTSKVRNLIPACFTGCTPTAFKFKISMESKIDDITRRLEELCNKNLGLKEIPGGTSTAVWRRPESSSLPTGPAFFGRKEDQAKIVEMVLSNEPSDVNFRVISIVGMGGLGKTTLAQEVFNDEAVKNFNPKAWVCISDDFDPLKISKALLESITRKPCDLKALDPVQVELKNAVAGKKFLLVLDDVWCRDYGLWETLMSPFMAGAPGSKIIVTTRIKDIALKVGRHRECYELKLLEEDEIWAIFENHVSAGNRDIAKFRENVLKKCRGLPLAARTLGGLLRSEESEDVWENILNSKIWDLDSDILPVLKLSYHHLPSHLKRCFAYCAIFPKDYEFAEEDLVLLWMAEGLIQQSEKKQLEDLGREYFRELLSRSVFQQSTNDLSKFSMHDLVSDLAQSISRDTSFILEDKLNMPENRFKRIRHSSYFAKCYEVKNRFKDFHRVENLRTFLPLQKFSNLGTNYVSTKVFLDLLPKLKRLRVLSLAHYNLNKLPDSIGDLTHLRYLNLSYTDVCALPESVGTLFNLQVLKLRKCQSLYNLPSNMGNLINLRYLDILGSSIREMPLGMGKLKCLRKLSSFIVGRDSGASLIELKDLKLLSGEIVISSLQNMVDSQYIIRESILIDKKDLHILVLEGMFRHSGDMMVEENILNMLQPYTNLQQLTIKNYGGKRFPPWVGNPSFSNMVVLYLDGCWNCDTLPSLAQLGSLKNLTIRHMENLKMIGSEIYGGDCTKSFQSLETLHFDGLPLWKRWDPEEENEQIQKFPRLQKLSISGCEQLSGRLPNNLPFLEELVIDECQKLVVSFSYLPMLRLLKIKRCKGMVCSDPIYSQSLDTETCGKLNFPVFKNWSRQGFQKIQSLEIVGCVELVDLWPQEICDEKPPQGLHNFCCLKKLILHNLPYLVSIPDGFLSILSEVYLTECHALTSLHEGLKHSNPRLESLNVRYCSSLRCIVRGLLPPSLKQLTIESCGNLLCLWDDKEDTCSTSSSLLHPSSPEIHKEDMDNATASLELRILGCPFLTCLSSTDRLLPATLTLLEIERCSNLNNLFSSSRGQLSKTLKFLHISGCPEIESIVERFDNNTSLETIEIEGCRKLEFLPDGLHTLGSLRKISVKGCASLRRLLDGGLPNTGLLEISIAYCETLEALPEGMHSLKSLQRLDIMGCPRISNYPKEGFPTSLTSLTVGDVNFYKHLAHWGFHKLTSLTSLNIWDCADLECFPDKYMEMILPSSLTQLYLSDLPKLKNLSSEGFQNLSSLESLEIHDCPELTSLPSLSSSFKSLSIFGCPKLEYLPSLPSSVETLCIEGCPFLAKKYGRDEGKEWSKIADIPLSYAFY